MKPVERAFELPGLTIRGLEWGEPGGLPLFALHGWLDNAGSFDLIAPLLGGCHLVAPDAAGHGLSDHRSPDSAYHLWQDLGDLLEIADRLGWERFGLLGHSRGAAVAMLFGATFPDRVSHLLFIEGGLPIVGEAAEAPANLERVLQKTRELRGRRGGRVYASRDEAIAERVDGFSPVTTAAADILARRSLLEVDGGWQWQADQRLKAGSEIRLTVAEVAAFVERVAAPTFCVMAEESPFADLPVYRDLMGRFRQIELCRLPGRHHLHLEGGAEEIAARMRQFLGLAPNPADA